VDAWHRNGRRWDVVPGTGGFSKVVNIQDFTSLIIKINRSCTEATPNPPPATTSWYVVDEFPYSWFSDLGRRYGRSGQSGVVIFDFGQPAREYGLYGTLLNDHVTDQFISHFQASSLVADFAFGWAETAPEAAKIRVVMGTNNFPPYEVTPPPGPFSLQFHGTLWADRIEALNATFMPSFGDRIVFWGGSDIEPDFAPPAGATEWVDGYIARGGTFRYLNYGSADGCPPGSGQGGTPIECNNGWSQEDVYYVSWGSTLGEEFPDIYLTDGTNAAQWKNLSLYGYYAHDQEIIGFQGTLTQWQGCDGNPAEPDCATEQTDNPPIQGWAQLRNIIQSDPRTTLPTTYLNYSSDIEWQRY
jgi:hypothetical protein